MRKFIAIIILFLLFFNSVNLFVYADGTYAHINTADGNDGSADAINFSQGRVWTIDKYGKYIWLTQARTGPQHHWAWSNDNGSNWSQGSEGYNFLIRGSVAYDSINDKLHVIWTTNTCDSGGGIIYRRYGITRNGSNDITAISREDSSNINLQLDITGNTNCQQPVALWVNDGSTNGILVAIWSKNAEIRGSMRKLSLSAADGVASNWKALDGTDDSFTNAPEVDADLIYNDSSGAAASSAIIRGGTGSRKDDLYVFVAESDGNSGDSVLAYRAVWDGVDKDWSGGWQSPITVGNMDTSAGYNAKHELITKPVLDSTNDRLYVGWARWKTGGAGDTVSLAYLNSTDVASSTFDGYSANGTHSYAPTLDIAYDQTLGEIYLVYVTSTTNGNNGDIAYKTFNGTSFSSATTFYTSPGGSAGADGGADIPIMYENRYNNRLLFGFRINGALPPTGVDPHIIDSGYITLATPTATPTMTPTPTPTSQPTPTPTSVPSSSSSSSNENPSTTTNKSCTDNAPSGKPDLFQIDTTKNSAKLFFAPVSNTNKYFIAYGLSPGDDRYGVELNSQDSSGVLSYEIGYLEPNTTYYARIRGGNGCMPGEWGNEMKFTINGSYRYYKNLISQVLSFIPKQTTTLTKSVSTKPTKLTGKTCQYIVQSGDTLWSIASNKLAGGYNFPEIIDSNRNAYPDLSADSILSIGWKFKIKC